MNYGLIRMSLSSASFLPINEETFIQLRQSMNGLYKFLCIEESYDAVIENYLELETTLVDAAVRRMITGDDDSLSFRRETNLFNRRLMNLLSTCRAYIDHTQRHIDNLFKDGGPESRTLELQIEKLYSSSLVYRAFHHLRNHGQHNGFPVHAVTWDMRVPEAMAPGRLQYSVIPYVSPALLRSDVKFPGNILDEMEAAGERIDLRPILRGYIETLGSLHESVRSILKPSTEQWEIAVTNAFRDFIDKFPEEDAAVKLAAVVGATKANCSDQVPIFRDFIAFRETLARKNTALKRLPGRYVTTEATGSSFSDPVNQ